MKKIIALQLFLLLSYSLAASYYTSNALGQQKAALEEFSSSGYVLKVEDNTSTLYLDGSLVQTKSISNNVEIIESGNRKETKTFTPEGLLTCVEVLEQGDTELLTYEYRKNGTLRRIVKTLNGALSEITLINYSDLSGLTSIIKDANISYFNDKYYLYTKDTDSVFIDASIPSLLVKTVSGKEGEERGQEIVYTSNGFYVREKLKEGFEDTYYLNSGKIDKLIVQDTKEEVISQIQYYYDAEGVLTKEVQTESEEVKTITYVNGKAVSLLVVQKGETMSEFFYNEDLTTKEIRYRNNKPYVEILYDFDNKSILDVVVL